MKIWEKSNSRVNINIEEFTIGKDKLFDSILAKYDVIGSIAHVTMLGETGIMSEEESKCAITELNTILENIEKGQFEIEEGIEDIHTMIEILLTRSLGEIGKKIHTGRSRNDQILTDIKLFLKDEIKSLAFKTKELFDLLINLSEKYKDYLLPGYTHMQIAMPSSFGLWFGAYAESFVDDMEFLVAAFNICDKNPLGSGAGYGTSFPINRKRTTEILGFKTMNTNSIYAQMTRGKSERSCATAISGIASTLSKLSMDICLYMNQNFDFISFPDELTTGSSIMPHKKNPDVFELIRGKCNRLQSLPNEITLLINNLPSGYHREFQLTKEIIFPAFQEVKSCLEITILMLKEIKVNENILNNPLYEYIFTVDSVNELIKEGVSFREAYKLIGDKINEGSYSRPQKLINTTHEGSINNLCNADIITSMNYVLSRLK